MKSAVLLLTSVFFYLTSSVGYAKSNTELLLNLTHCSTIASDDVRLNCFDKLVLPTAKLSVVAAITVVPTIVDSKPIELKQVEQKQIDDFAKDHLKKAKEQEPSSIIATVSKVKKLLRGQWLIYLENNQKWQQTDTAKIKLKVGDTVRLNKGAMGAIYLYKEGGHRSIKVKRLK
ncbi:MAG: hypothetical protein JKX90_06950 [Colwellia sp.]|nr:hypothetical protein [Colwellia sp.]